ncbi:MAG: hypothetical protein ACK5O2_04205 [Microthrixaceae bacterium]
MTVPTNEPTDTREWHETCLRWLTGSVVVVAVGFGLLAACSKDAEVDAGADTSSTTASSTTASSTTTTTGAGVEATTTSPEGEGTELTVPQDRSTTQVSVPRPDMEPSGLVDVRSAQHPGFDRVVFEFDGPVPGYDVRYAEVPLTEEGSGSEVGIDGAKVVTILMDPGSTARITDAGYEDLYTGADRIAGAGDPVNEVVEVSDFEGRSIWAVGLTAEVDFAVSTLESPSRLVVDFVAD